MDDESPESRRGSPTHKFARQHEELGELAKALLRALDTRAIAVDPTPVRRSLAAFSGRLRVHAAMEQEALYPRLLASSDAAVAHKAKELFDEVGGIYDLFFEHLARWSTRDAIQADPESFCRETMFLLHRLKLRMKRENEELYPLVDAADPGASGERPTGKLLDEEPEPERRSG